MRKIISKKDEGKKARRNQLIIGGILILVMIASSVGYAFTRDQTTSETQIIYKGYTFTQTSNLWYVDVGSYQFSFKYNPTQTQSINSALNPLANYANEPLYIYSENTAAATEIYRNLFYQNSIVQRVQSACPEGTTCSDNSPVKTCDNNFIIIRDSNSTGITQNKNCVYIEGKNENLTALSDTFLFKITGIQ
jgi:hypothetical protein